jgi:AcrR family transcriptional regulator
MADQTTPNPKLVLSPKERRQRNRDEMITAILDAARAVMREEGVAALNLQEIARRVGMRAPSLYTYFPSKIAIYEALYVRGIRIFRERVERDIQAYGVSWAAIRAALTNYMSFAQEFPELYQLVFERPVPGFTPSQEGLDEGRRLIESSYRAMAQLVESGLIVPGTSPEQANDLFVAIMHGLTALHIANEPQLPVGSGRFGSLIPVAEALLRAAWSPK